MEAVDHQPDLRQQGRSIKKHLVKEGHAQFDPKVRDYLLRSYVPPRPVAPTPRKLAPHNFALASLRKRSSSKGGVLSPLSADGAEQVSPQLVERANSAKDVVVIMD